MGKPSKPKSQVKAMVDYFNRNPIQPPPRRNVTGTRSAIKGHLRAFKIDFKKWPRSAYSIARNEA